MVRSGSPLSHIVGVRAQRGNNSRYPSDVFRPNFREPQKNSVGARVREFSAALRTHRWSSVIVLMLRTRLPECVATGGNERVVAVVVFDCQFFARPSPEQGSEWKYTILLALRRKRALHIVEIRAADSLRMSSGQLAQPYSTLLVGFGESHDRAQRPQLENYGTRPRRQFRCSTKPRDCFSVAVACPVAFAAYAQQLGIEYMFDASTSRTERFVNQFCRFVSKSRAKHHLGEKADTVREGK